MTKHTGISRRSFLQGMALGTVGASTLGVGGLALAGCAPQAKEEAPSKSQGSTPASGTGTSTTGTLNPQDYNYTTNSITDFGSSTLFSDWQLGPLTIHNRMVKSAAFQLAFMKNNPDEYIGYYERMAKGGVEMIWVEDFANIWDMTASPLKQDYGVYDVKALLDRLHAAGAHVGYQFDTMGSAIGPLDFTENFLGNYSTDEVKSWVQTIVGIGKKLHDDGFDAYELNFAANNVGQSFLSRARNNRTDEYGPQTLESRTKFAVEVIKGVKEACGKDFVVQVLINGIEANDKMLGQDAAYNSVEEVKAIAKILEEAGADSLHVRLGPCGQHIAQFANDLYFTAHGLEGASGFGTRFDFSRHYQGKLRANHSGCGMMIDVAAEIKSAVSIPVGAATYMDPAQAPDYFEEALAEGKLDFLVMNRPLCVDPEYVNKLREGRIDEIAPCTRCLHCFYDPDKSGKLMEHCRVNAANWRAFGEDMPEGWTPAPAATPKKVMVIGGGPAGMEAARVAAERGHEVTLYEKSGSLGGLLTSAAAIKGPHENLERLSTYLAKQQEVAGVNVKLSTEVDAALIKQEKPDAVVLAVGGTRPEAEFSATSGTAVLSFADVVGAEMGDKVTVLGSNAQSVDVAVFLLAQGKHVTIVTPDPMELFEKGHSVNVRGFIESAIAAQGVRVWPSAKVIAVGDGEITFTSEAGVEETVACDALVDMRDMMPNTALIDGLSGVETVAVGDCADPYNISEAIASANLAARKL
ncbi:MULTISPECIES: FAD-dependent oxidoreductase [Gordonibacter]|uniref:FAD-dependent oxidoreductase n=1 Tax=Gordonibacter faecis TaxID=3047475 RepID=A0ABT7DQP2_9ACTN|nr:MULTISPECIES: FAD-dependent oxidoreductase [unclassified Gordonibacter]MDJ1651853.1 FAD-dependent oxidoreductase [Gordonibacter sp. KGMB12511]HIW75614.1 FAD-dependent oxidoreductase [Candidatus Gordonibacter avicola]